LIAPKFADAHLHQFRVRKQPPALPTNRKEKSRSQGIRPRMQKKAGERGVDSGNRQICLHCHFLGQKVCWRLTNTIPQRAYADAFAFSALLPQKAEIQPSRVRICLRQEIWTHLLQEHSVVQAAQNRNSLASCVVVINWSFSYQSLVSPARRRTDMSKVAADGS
jgi:hypothetical protein